MALTEKTLLMLLLEGEVWRWHLKEKFELKRQQRKDTTVRVDCEYERSNEQGIAYEEGMNGVDEKADESENKHGGNMKG